MKFFKMPDGVVGKHRDALALHIENLLAGLYGECSGEPQRPCRDYLSCLMKEHEFDESILCKPIDELATVVERVNAVKVAHPGEDWGKFEKRIALVFNYKAKFRDARAWNTGKYIEMMIDAGLRYCPYCNYQLVEANPRTRGDDYYHKGPLDHFYPQEYYPYLALSIYNLIPVCHTCNNQKGRKDCDLSTHSHPFFDDYHSLVRFESKGGDGFQVLHGKGDVDGFEVVLKEMRKKRSSNARRLSDDVDLGGRYRNKGACQVALEILRKSEKYCKANLQILRGLTQSTEAEMNECLEDIFGVAMDGHNINECQFGKLRNDMLPAAIKSAC